MYVCMYVCIYVCMYVCMYVFMYVCMYIYIYIIHLYIYIYMSDTVSVFPIWDTLLLVEASTEAVEREVTCRKSREHNKVILRGAGEIVSRY